MVETRLLELPASFQSNEDSFLTTMLGDAPMTVRWMCLPFSSFTKETGKEAFAKRTEPKNEAYGSRPNETIVFGQLISASNVPFERYSGIHSYVET